MKNILIIENNNNGVNTSKFQFEKQRWKVTYVKNRIEGLAISKKIKYDLIILNCNPLNQNDFTFCKEIHTSKDYTPIFFLSKSCEEIDKVLALEMGADDYLSIPFNQKELVARINAIFRRVNSYSESFSTNKKLLKFQNLEIDLDKRKVSLSNKRLNLSRREYEIVMLLATHPGKIYSRERILRLVWGSEFEGSVNAIPSQISRLRSKLEPDTSAPLYIRTHWGVGYSFQSSM